MAILSLDDGFTVGISEESSEAIQEQTGNLTDLQDWEEKQILMKNLPIEKVRLAAKAYGLAEEKRGL